MRDGEHFEDYREQTAVKHTILEKYVAAYFHVLKKQNRNMVYIDGFAGRGTYTEQATGAVHEGSPLRVLRTIAANDELASSVSTIFIERDPELAGQLKAVVGQFCANHPRIREPRIFVGEFADKIQDLLNDLANRRMRLAPSFVFVDPCGVAGTSLVAMQRLMNEAAICELFIFFNIDGLRRTVGLDKVSDALLDVVGTKERAQELLGLWHSKSDAAEREEAILDYYEDLLRTGMGADFITPFRIEHENRRAASHYLIHVTRHPLGFKIMKDVMWPVGRTDEGVGALELQQASITGMSPLFRMRAEEIKRQVLEELSAGPRPVRHFYEELVQQPGNRLSEPAYREALLELEEEGQIVVLAKDGSGTIAWERVVRKGKKTLAKEYSVRLATPADRASKPT